MSNENLQKFEELKSRLDRAKIDFAKVETLLEEKKKEYKKVEDEIRAQGIDPNDLGSAMAKLSADLLQGFQQMETLLEQAEQGLQKVNK